MLSGLGVYSRTLAQATVDRYEAERTANSDGASPPMSRNSQITRLPGPKAQRS